jgi:acyl carrier protein
MGALMTEAKAFNDLQKIDPAVRVDITAGVRDIVGEVGEGPATDETLRSMDSIALVELVVRLEERFGLEVPDTSLNDTVFESIDNLCVLIAGELSLRG